MAAGLGTGTSISFGTSNFTANILSIDGQELSRVSVQTSHLGTTDYHTFIPGKLVDPGGVDIEIQFDPDDFPPIDEDTETITVSFGTGGSWAASGFATGFTWGAPLEDMMTGTLTVKFSGPITPTPAGT